MLKKTLLIHLLEQNLRPTPLSGCHLHVISEDIFVQTLKEKLQTQSKEHNELTGPQAAHSWSEIMATPNLFGDQLPTLVTLPEKITAKAWKEWLKIIQNTKNLLKDFSGSYSCFIAPLSLRHLFTNSDLSCFENATLTFSPQPAELLKCASILAKKYPSLSQQNMTTLSEQALRYYSGCLVSIDQHWKRMHASALSFEEALISHAEVDAFDVVQAIAERDEQLTFLRLKQCAQNELDLNSVWGAVVHFLRQCARVQTEFSATKNMKHTFEALQIPYPMQDRLAKAVEKYQIQELVQFFVVAPQIELALRKQRRGWDMLAHEIQSFVHSGEKSFAA